MRKILFLFCVISTSAFATKRINQADWQQRVDYEIKVQLDDVNHVLYGWVKMVYKNNSPHDLDSIYMHLWPNAYAHPNTPFGRQFLQNGSTDFHFAEESERGYMDSLHFEVNGMSVQHKLLPGANDIALLTLASSLGPGESLEITTPFRVKIPGRFSRFGHDGQDYQITQWYPKPAVYDVNGWNPISYHNQGEFYSEFGRFQVQITIPENYLVAATGVLQEEAEWAFIRKRKDNPLESFTGIESSGELKTITYVQDDVHDFAWFASKYFNVEEDEVELHDGTKVQAFVFAPEKKINHTRFIASALKFYSKNCGVYPYQHCTVVQGPLEAGGGMEYPMITVVSDLGEEVIVHEVGHNWFQGMLASDEWNYPWMDESINSYFEYQTMHGAKGSEATLNKPSLKFDEINDQSMKLLSRWIESEEMHQAIGAPSAEFTSLNYGLIVYGKGSLIFNHLHAYLGEETFYNAFREYFNKWAMKHPLPGDIKNVFETVSGEDLSWFFNELIQEEGHLDYKMMKISDGKLTVLNNGMVNAPYPIGLFKDGELVLEVWQPGHRGAMQIELPGGMEYDLVKIDPYGVMTESNRQNNTIRVSGAFKRIEPLNIRLYGGLKDENHTSLFIGPVIGWNQYNKTMAGLMISNSTFPTPKFYMNLMPMYSFTTEDLNGYGKLAYHHHRNARLREVEIGVKAARFGYRPFELYTYNRIAPYIDFKIRPENKRVRLLNSIKLRYTNTSFNPQFDQQANIDKLILDTANYNRRQVIVNDPDHFIDLVISRKDDAALNPFSYRLNVQYGLTSNSIRMYDTSVMALTSSSDEDDFIKINLTLEKHINYSLKGKGLDVRIFLGGYLKTPESGLYQYRIGSQSGRYDYTFEQTVMGRNATEGLYRNQIIPSEMNLKLSGNFGNIPGYVVSANLVSDLPGKLPLKVYLDLFNYQDIQTAPNNLDGEQIGYSGGLLVSLIKDVCEIYVPLVNSGFLTETQRVQGLKDFNQRITFKLDLNRLANFNLTRTLNNAF